MPGILTGEERGAWLEADVEAALKLQRPLPAERLAIVAKRGLVCVAEILAPSHECDSILATIQAV